MTIPTAPPSGFRDFSPKDCALRSRAVEAISRAYRSFGFQQIATSAVEDLQVLLGKGGGENEKLIFKIQKRGEKLAEAARVLANPLKQLTTEDYVALAADLADLGLRFDLTLPLARYYSKYGSQLPHPFKAFHIGPVWRAERAQKGRYREFFQCDADIIGADGVMGEIDVISAIFAAFDSLGVSGVQVVLNDRSYVYQALDCAGVAPCDVMKACIIIDKLDKIGREKVIEELKLAVGPAQTEDLKKFLLTDNPDRAYPFVRESLARVEQVANAIGASRARIEPSLMRGFDYYTGPVFEFRHPNFSGSVGGGGRYDKLTEKFGGQPVPAVGGSIGFERLMLLLEEEAESGPDYVVTVFSDELREKTLELARHLRAAGKSVDVYPGSGKLKQQFKYADSKRAACAIVMGPDEASRGEFKVKDLKTGQERAVKLESLATGNV